MTENEIAKIMVDIFLKIHRKIGPGLFESVYESAVCYELDKLEIQYKRQVEVAVVYENIKMPLGFRADIIVDDKLIIELKSIENISALHHKQLLSYLKLTNLKLGLLVNFNVVLIKHGITRIVNNL